jgi:aromatic ring-cleaving dioxygenase
VARDFVDPVQIRSYHAHIYYDPGTRELAQWLRDGIASNFIVELGRWHDEPDGPHPTSMYQVAFAVCEFSRLVPWLMLNRGALNVLIHPQTGASYEDHSAHASWLGKKLPLRLDGLRRRSS